MSDGQSEIVTTSGHPYRVLVAGPARCGKDTVAALLAKASGGVLRAGPSTSEFYCQKAHGDRWREALEHYKSSGRGRDNLAFEMALYNHHHKGTPRFPGAQLYGEMVAAGIDLLVGIRRLEEVKACVRLHLLTHAVWVRRDVPEDATLDYGLAVLSEIGLPVYVLDNYGGFDELPARVARCWGSISQ